MPSEQIAQRDHFEIIFLLRGGPGGQPLKRMGKPSSSAERGQGTMAGDAKEPCPWALDTGEPGVVPESVAEGVLQQIFSQPPVANHLYEKSTQLGLTADEQILDGLRVCSLKLSSHPGCVASATTGGAGGDV